VDKKNMDDLSGDGGVTKMVLTAGEGWQSPEDGDEVSMHYSGKLTDGTEFDSSYSRGEPFKFKIGAGSVIKGWDITARKMLRGEKAEVTLAAEYAYGENGSPPKIPGGATLVFIMELVGWKSMKDIFGDGMVIKTVLADGDGWERPSERCEVTMGVIAKSESDPPVVFFQGDLVFAVGEGKVPKAWEKVVVDMKKGGRIRLVCQGDYIFAPSIDFVPAGTQKLVYELELKSWLKVEDVNRDGTIIKKILVEGEGWERPNEGATVEVTGTMWPVRGGFRVENIMYPYDGYTFRVSDGEVCDGMDRVVQTMKKNEKAIITVDPSVAFTTCPSIIPPGFLQSDALEVEITLNDFQKAKDSWSMSFQEKGDEMRARKMKGNELFKAGRVKLAMKAYERAISFFEYSTSELSPDLKKQINALLVQCHLNMTACYDKLDNTDKVLHHAKLALDIDPANVKALYRRGSVYLKIDDYYKAESDLKHAKSLDPNNIDVLRKLRELSERRRKQDDQDRKLYSNMFKRLHKLEEQEKMDNTSEESSFPQEDANGVSRMEEGA